MNILKGKMMAKVINKLISRIFEIVRFKSCKQMKLLSISFVFFIIMPSNSQTKSWIHDKSKDNRISVKYRISKQIIDNEKSIPLIEYSVQANTKVPLSNFIKLMKNVSKHKQFEGDDNSELIRKLSDNEWLIYYYTKGRGPIPDSDCLLNMSISNNQNVSIVTIVSSHLEEKKSKARRIKNYKYVYSFNENGDGTTSIVIDVKVSPPFAVPTWMIKTSFPKAPFKFCQNIIDLASEIN